MKKRLGRRFSGGLVSKPSHEEVHRLERAKAGGLQIGGGITDANAQEWIDAGASKVCRLYLLRTCYRF